MAGGSSRPPGRYAAAPGVAAVFLAALLGGCASFFPGTPDAIFDLSAPDDVAAPSGSAAQILVPEPSAIKALDNERIAARPTPAEYAYLPGALWSDRLPRVLQTSLMETLQNTGRVRAAALPGQGVLIDYQIILDIRRFEIADGSAVAEFALKLMNDRNGQVVETAIIRQAAPVLGDTNAAYVAALDQAMDAAYADIVRLVLSAI